MTVKELKKILEQTPDDMDVWFEPSEYDGKMEFINSTRQEVITLSENGKPPKAKVKVLLLEGFSV